MCGGQLCGAAAREHVLQPLQTMKMHGFSNCAKDCFSSFADLLPRVQRPVVLSYRAGTRLAGRRACAHPQRMHSALAAPVTEYSFSVRACFTTAASPLCHTSRGPSSLRAAGRNRKKKHGSSDGNTSLNDALFLSDRAVSRCHSLAKQRKENTPKNMRRSAGLTPGAGLQRCRCSSSTTTTVTKFARRR